MFGTIRDDKKDVIKKKKERKQIFKLNSEILLNSEKPPSELNINKNSKIKILKNTSFKEFILKDNNNFRDPLNILGNKNPEDQSYSQDLALLMNNENISGSEDVSSYSIDSNSNKVKRIHDENFKMGRWQPEEHHRFIEAILKYGNEWKKVKKHVGSRSSTQARSHAQKFFVKIKRTNLLDLDHDLNKGSIKTLQEVAIQMNTDQYLTTIKKLNNVAYEKKSSSIIFPKKIKNENLLENLNSNNNANFVSLNYKNTLTTTVSSESIKSDPAELFESDKNIKEILQTEKNIHNINKFKDQIDNNKNIKQNNNFNNFSIVDDLENLNKNPVSSNCKPTTNNFNIKTNQKNLPSNIKILSFKNQKEEEIENNEYNVGLNKFSMLNENKNVIINNKINSYNISLNNLNNNSAILTPHNNFLQMKRSRLNSFENNMIMYEPISNIKLEEDFQSSFLESFKTDKNYNINEFLFSDQDKNKLNENKEAEKEIKINFNPFNLNQENLYYHGEKDVSNSTFAIKNNTKNVNLGVDEIFINFNS